MVGRKHVAPDGGWGWVIVASYAISNIINIPILQGFGLLFRSVFSDLQMSATDVSIIININSAFGMVLGLWNGPLLRKFGFRKLAMAGSLIAFIGLCLTSTATTFQEFIIYYGIINSMGFIWVMASFSLALNTYFSKRRSRASGICMTATGLGPVFMPLLISELLKHYGVRGTTLILSAMGLHAFSGAMLLQPVKWHYPQPQVETGEASKQVEELEVLNIESEKEKEGVEEAEPLEIDFDDIDKHSLHEMEPSLVPRRCSDAGQLSIALGRRNMARSLSCLSNKPERIFEPEPAWWNKSSPNVNGHQPHPQPAALPQLPEDTQIPNGQLESNNQKLEQQSKNTKWYMKVVRFFDLDLLRDPIYRNIWLGMASAFTAEINFSLMTPLILGDRKFDIQQTATIMSTIGIADIVSRFFSPFVGDRLNTAPRYLYMYSLIMLVFFRAGLTLVYSYGATIAIAVGLGISKGFRSVYWTLVIPNQVPLEKLASASGLQTVLNGILLLVVGPLLGYARDAVGSYNACIHISNLLTLFTVFLWTGEYVYYRYYKAEKEQT